MSKKTIKEMFHEKINPSSIYNEILIQAEKKQKKKYTGKLILTSLCLAIIIGVGYKLIQNEAENPFVEPETEHIIRVNDMSQISQSKLDVGRLDMHAEKMNEKDLDRFDFINQLKLPSDFDGLYKYAWEIYTHKQNKEYQLYSYEFVFVNENENKKITLSFSEIGKPLRCYQLGEAKEKSMINDTQIEISKWEELYLVQFEYQDNYFDIETENISLDELIDLLDSIINRY